MNRCQWCGKSAVVEIIVERERFGMVAKNGGAPVKTLTHRAVTAWACDEHRFLPVKPHRPIDTPSRTKLKEARQANLWEVP